MIDIYYNGEQYDLAQTTCPLPTTAKRLGRKDLIKQDETITYTVVDKYIGVRAPMTTNNGTAQSSKVAIDDIQTIAFTGKLLLVRDFFRHNMIVKHNNPFMQIEAYDTIIELNFVGGHLVAVHDHSATMRALRGIARKWEDAKECEFEFLTQIGDWVQAIYGIEYDLWWLPKSA